jgi:hypothetical protein
MSRQTTLAETIGRDDSWMYRIGGVSALLLGLGYLAIIPLYTSVGVPPDGGQAWLVYGAGKTGGWWAILSLSVLTDLLFIPVGLALYLALSGLNRSVMLVATSLVGLFVVLDLAVTWSNYAALIALADQYAAAPTDAARAAYVGAAEYASAVLTSNLEAVYSIVTLSLGILLIGVVMLRSGFRRATAYLGVATGLIGCVSVAASLLASGLGVTIILASILTTIWVLLVAFELYRLGSSTPAAG